MKYETPKIVNVVGSGYFLNKLDVNAIARSYPSERYFSMVSLGKSKQHCVVIRYALYTELDKRVTVTIFSSGKSIISGAATFDALTYGFLATTIELFLNGMLSERMPFLVLVNVVMITKLANEPSLDELALLFPDCEYEPEQFPGLIYRDQETKRVALIFTKGRVVLPGYVKVDDAYKVLDNIVEFLEDFGLI